MSKSMRPPWQRVVLAADCAPCAGCGEPVCPECLEHYADCACPGPTQDDELLYHVDAGGVLWAMPAPGYFPPFPFALPPPPPRSKT